MDIWLKKHGVVDILCNDFDALVSRVRCVHDKEHSIVCLYVLNFNHVCIFLSLVWRNKIYYY